MFTRVAILLFVLIVVALLVPVIMVGVKKMKKGYQHILDEENHGEEHKPKKETYADDDHH